MMNFPIWITNFKNYEQSTGDNAVQLAKIHDEVAKETGANLAVAVDAIDLAAVAAAVSIPVFAQHVDPIEPGKGTGLILPMNVKKTGAVATLLNHSERRLKIEDLKKSAEICRGLSLQTLVCAENPAEIKELSVLSPNMLAFEPPELIGSTGASVASAKPDSITESVKNSNGIPILVGAGISSPEDVKVSLELGAKGFLVATAIVKADDPKAKLLKFVAAMSR